MKFSLDVLKAYIQLYKWIEGQLFIGYDPYDALNTEINILKKSKVFRLFLTYANKMSPINFRKVLNFMLILKY